MMTRAAQRAKQRQHVATHASTKGKKIRQKSDICDKGSERRELPRRDNDSPDVVGNVGHKHRAGMK